MNYIRQYKNWVSSRQKKNVIKTQLKILKNL